MEWNITTMAAGGQFGGRVHTAWFYQRQHFFIKNTWICIQTRCIFRFANMSPGKGSKDDFFPMISLPYFIILFPFIYNLVLVAEIVKISQCHCLSLTQPVLLPFGSKVVGCKISFSETKSDCKILGFLILYGADFYFRENT